MNTKAQGEKAVRIAIGELAKYDVDCAFPLTDNEAFDLVLIHNGKLFKTQIKSSSLEVNRKTSSNSISFRTHTSNWHKRTITKYKKGDYDLMICVDLRDYTVYLVEAEKTFNRKSFSIRTAPSKNGQKKACNMAADYVLSQARIDQVLV